MASEIDRLVDDLKNNDALLEEVENLAPGMEATVAWANERGYTFSLDEMVAHIEEENAELSDDDLDAVAGGVANMATMNTSALLRRPGGAIGAAIAGIAIGGPITFPGGDP